MPGGSPYNVFGSFVGLPWLSRIQPSGHICPAMRFTRTFPSAVALVPKSITSVPSGCGTPMAMGLVPNRGAVPPGGATRACCAVRVDHQQRNHSGGGGLFAVFAQATDVAGVDERAEGHAAFARPWR